MGATQIDFYILPDDEQLAPLHYTARLLEKIYRLGHRVYIYCSSDTQLTDLEARLWSLSEASFIPSARLDTDSNQALIDNSPVLIGCTPPSPALGGVLVNLSGTRPDFIDQFDRMAEIVPGRPEERTQSRENYRFYQQKGYPLQSHSIGQK